MKQANSIVPLGLVAVGCMFALPSGCSQPQHVSTDHSSVNLAALDDPALQVAGYREWRVVNPEKFILSPLMTTYCAYQPNRRPSPGHAVSAIPDAPLKRASIHVYVNPPAEAPMFEQLWPHFPQGSIIVKEKLSPLTIVPAPEDDYERWPTIEDPLPVYSDEPELLTVMIKREPGYNPEVGDWEFLVFDALGQTIEGRGRLTHCQQCHIPHAATDFVVRSYLPDDVLSGLK